MSDLQTTAVVPSVFKKVESYPIEEIRSKTVEAKETIMTSYFELGGLLYRTHYAELWKDWGFFDFDDYCTRELGFKVRRAQYFIQIFKKLHIELGLKDEDLQGMGWSKAKEIVPVVTKETFPEWAEKAKTMTVAEISNEASRIKKEKAGEIGEVPVKKSLFRAMLFEDQIGIIEGRTEQ